VRRLGFLVVLALTSASLLGEEPYWVQPMRAVHARFTGTPGTIMRMGDSITWGYTIDLPPPHGPGAFFNPLREPFANASPEAQEALDWLSAYMPEECWDWIGPDYGNEGGQVSSWPLDRRLPTTPSRLEWWLENLQPEMAVILFGTNDNKGSVPTFTANMRQIVQTCKDYGTIPILTTVPPLAPDKTDMIYFVEAIRALAEQEQVPLIDYYQAIMTRRPTDYYPILISTDKIHPTWPEASRYDFSETALNSNGYTLRNYLTLMTCYDVYRQVIIPEPISAAGLLAGGLALLARRPLRRAPRRYFPPPG